MKLSIGILTGGKSKRMGANKAFLKYNDEKNFLEHALDEALAVSDDVILSVDEEGKYVNFLKGREKAGLKLVEDERKNFGPLEGIYRILKAAKEDYCFIFAVDMPYVNGEFINNFTSYINLGEKTKTKQKKTNAYILNSNNGIEPLCSLYSKDCLPYMEKLFEKDEHKLRMLFEESLKYEIVEICEFYKEDNVGLNINTPSDYKELFLK